MPSWSPDGQSQPWDKHCPVGLGENESNLKFLLQWGMAAMGQAGAGTRGMGHLWGGFKLSLCPHKEHWGLVVSCTCSGTW